MNVNVIGIFFIYVFIYFFLSFLWNVKKSNRENENEAASIIESARAHEFILPYCRIVVARGRCALRDICASCK